MFFETQTVKTPRLTMAYHHAGKSGAPRLMLIHGNASSSLFYLPIMKRLEDRFELVAPDCDALESLRPFPLTRLEA